jgi:hypothetical protein
MAIDYVLRAARLAAASAGNPNYDAYGRKVSKPKAAASTEPAHPDLFFISQKIMFSVSNCIPDGDPIDRLAPFIAAYVGCSRYDAMKWLDKAARKHLDVKSYNEYLIEAWDSWNEVCDPDQRMDNPWRAS